MASSSIAEDDEIVIVIGDGTCTLTLRVQGSLYTEWEDVVGLEWRAVKMSVEAILPAMTARFTRTIFIGELIGFYKGLVRLSRELKGAASFEDMENAVTLDVSIDATGHLTWQVKLSPFSYTNTGTLTFAISNDQSYLPGILKPLELLLVRFPS